ncbi:MAG: hypothetical protein M3450_00290 [Actinomycetota bacterium]|nr:hypothetical protein [Actinomycetota bacterium]MDQ3639925.1 hypothetical protein [Actinomycetota bacterium]
MRRLVAMMAILGVTVTACGGDTDDAGPNDATTTTTTLGTTTTTTLAANPSTTRAGKPTTTTRASNSTTTPVTLRCKAIGFTPGSDDVASDIRATGLSCREAESFVRVAGTRTNAVEPQEVDVLGYRCVRTRIETEGLPRAYYQCVNGRKKVTFVRS